MYKFYKDKIKTHKSFEDFINQQNILSEIKNILSHIGKPLFYDSNIDYKNLSEYYFPYYYNVFRFLENDITKIKYVILGMDPYPSYYFEDNKIVPVATGRSFEVSNIRYFSDKYKQVSLRNIIKCFYYDKHNIDLSFDDLREKIINVTDPNVLIKINGILKDNENSNNKKKIQDVIYEFYKNKESDNDDKIILLPSYNFFDTTEKQGILWLNSTLTVKPNNPNSHTEYYMYFMTELIKYIHYVNNKIKWLVWGLNAKNRITGLIPNQNIYYCCHPATRVNNDFVNKNCFQYMKDIFLYY